MLKMLNIFITGHKSRENNNRDFFVLKEVMNCSVIFMSDIHGTYIKYMIGKLNIVYII